MDKKNFLWGAATASYQCEGAWNEDGKGLGEWDVFAHESPLNINGATGDVSCDFYHRYREDLDLLAAGGQNSFRFSISWARVLPQGSGEVNRAGIDFYNRVIDYCLKKRLVPNVTLFHYDLPQSIAERGGFANREVVDAFEKYADVCFKEFGDRVKLWVTINEPKYYAYCSNIVGNYPPNHALDFDRYFRVLYHEVLASARVVARYHALGLGGQIGIVHDSSNVEIAPGTRDPQSIRLKANLFYNRIILDSALRGEMPGPLIPFLRSNHIDDSCIKFEDAISLENGVVDFLGLNIYNRMYLTDYGGDSTEVLHNNQGKGSKKKEGIRIAGWYKTTDDPETKRNLWGREIYPRCMYNTLIEIKERYGDVAIYITENGHGCYESPDESGYVDDGDRIEMMQAYIDNMFFAMSDGCDVRGYYAWSPMDLYSWVNGYEKRYGLIRVDFDDPGLVRMPKKSYHWFKQLIEDYRAGANNPGHGA